MNAIQKAAFDFEVNQAGMMMSRGELADAFTCLERAHVIGQSHVVPHVIAHWLMFRIALRRHQFVAAWGQVIRMLLGAVGSAVGVIPVGNTGGSNVSMFKRMPIAPDLQRIIDGDAPADARA